MLIDSHSHLSLKEFDKDRDSVINRAIEKEIALIDVGISLESSKESILLSKSHENIYATVGIHPHNAEGLSKSTLDEFISLIKNEPVTAIGEIGLDYYRNRSSKEAQKDTLIRLINIALEFKMPVIIHCREAYEDITDILGRYKSQGLRGVIHCFSGTRDNAVTLLEMGFYISFSGVITFPSADTLRETARFAPVNRILIETDSPYLTPKPFRGKRNEPSYLVYTAEKLAEIKNLTIQDINRITSINTFKLFGVGQPSITPKISYLIRDSLYLNITNDCTNKCTFCAKFKGELVKGHNLFLEKEPSEEEILDSIKIYSKYKEVVFCGYGEPTLRLDIIKKVSCYLKDNGHKVRLNTNGHGNMIAGRNILPELKGLIDHVSISINAENKDKYSSLCNPANPDNAYNAVIDFINKSKEVIPEVTITAVDLKEATNIEAVINLAKELGVNFRLREFNRVG